jgi:hypothetical protein
VNSCSLPVAETNQVSSALFATAAHSIHIIAVDLGQYCFDIARAAQADIMPQNKLALRIGPGQGIVMSSPSPQSEA